MPAATPSSASATLMALQPTTVAALPASPKTGYMAVVNDADTPVVGSAVAAGASAVALVMYDGAAWAVMGVAAS